ncbi:MAG: DoxX family protein [Polyangiaceae bacterium]|nr:DoxX family protein [Polyangiaceae bacterium]
MTSHVEHRVRASDIRGEIDVTSYLVPIGRLLFAAIFLTTIIGHFKAETIQHAAAAGVPLASIAVPLSGIIAFIGGLSVALGYKAKLGALLIVLFLVPVTLMMHAFWKVDDPATRQIQMIMFMKNLSMLGAALMLIHQGAGPFSFDNMERTRRSR